MVLQVLADAGQVVHDFDARGLEHGARTDPGALQQMRRADRTGSDDDLATATRGLDRSAALVFDPDGATLLDQDAPGHRTGDDVQVRARHGRPQVGVRRRPAHAVLDRHVHRAEALLHVAVRIVGLAVARLVARLDEGAVERVLHVVASR